MSFQVMKNDHVVVVCGYGGLGPQWLQIEFVFCVTLCCCFVCWLLCNTGQYCSFCVLVLCTLWRKYHHQKWSFLIHVIIVMAYVFNVFHVVTVMYNGGNCIYFENVQHCKSFWVCDCACDIILVELWNSSYVVLTLKCVFILIMFVSRKCSRSCFLSLFKKQNMRKGYRISTSMTTWT
jgi:hypothetical protein